MNLVPRRFLVFLLLFPVVSVFAQERGTNSAQSEYIRSHYTKQDYMIPMRDGLKLFTAVYIPKDTSQAWPFMMQRTPYSAGQAGTNNNNYKTALGPSELFSREGFIFVYQDVRGRYLSEGIFEDVPVHKTHFNGPTNADESTDTYDTIDWLVKNVPNNNGRVGTWGISYPGFFSAFSLIDSHPALKAASPQAPMADVGNGDDAYHNGAFFLAANLGFYTGFYPRGPVPAQGGRGRGRFSFGTQDQYDFYLRLGPLANAEERIFKHANEYWTDMVTNSTYNNFWSSRALSPHMKKLTAAVLLVGGWYDAEDLGGVPKLYNALANGSGAPAYTLVMGPWTHGSWARGDGDKLGNLNFGEKLSAFYRESIEFPFFMQYLKDKGDGLKSASDKSIPKAWLFGTGANEWKRFAEWPPKNAVSKSLYLDAGGKLSFKAPASSAGYDDYVSDPSRPVPVSGEIGAGMPGDYMTYDQRFASRRPDVLSYETEPLEKAVTIAGPVSPKLHVSTSGTDSDFDVKLIDVYPNDTPDPNPNPRGVRMGGYQQMIRGEPFRGKFRNSMSKPEAFKPGKEAKVEFVMPDVLHTFLPGHRIMVQIQSSWFPLTDRNPQKFVDIPSAKAADFQKATQRVYRGGSDGTRVEVMVVE
jgi:putative CocE/NonD family hydrolase